MIVYEIIFDTETKKFFDGESGSDPSKLGVSIISAYFRKVNDNFEEIEGQMKSFWEDSFSEFFKLVQGADRIIGFNSKGFDVPALSAYLPDLWQKLPHFDILEEIKKVEGKRVSLDSLAKATLGLKKNDNGENAIRYWIEHSDDSLGKLKKYCEMDVEITKNIYDYAFKNKFLKYIDFWNDVHEVKLDFSYPQKRVSNVQHSLF